MPNNDAIQPEGLVEGLVEGLANSSDALVNSLEGSEGLAEGLAEGPETLANSSVLRAAFERFRYKPPPSSSSSSSSSSSLSLSSSDGVIQQTKRISAPMSQHQNNGGDDAGDDDDDDENDEHELEPADEVAENLWLYRVIDNSTGTKYLATKLPLPCQPDRFRRHEVHLVMCGMCIGMCIHDGKLDANMQLVPITKTTVPVVCARTVKAVNPKTANVTSPKYCQQQKYSASRHAGIDFWQEFISEIGNVTAEEVCSKWREIVDSNRWSLRHAHRRLCWGLFLALCAERDGPDGPIDDDGSVAFHGAERMNAVLSAPEMEVVIHDLLFPTEVHRLFTIHQILHFGRTRGNSDWDVLRTFLRFVGRNSGFLTRSDIQDWFTWVDPIDTFLLSGVKRSKARLWIFRNMISRSSSTHASQNNNTITIEPEDLYQPRTPTPNISRAALWNPSSISWANDIAVNTVNAITPCHRNRYAHIPPPPASMRPRQRSDPPRRLMSVSAIQNSSTKPSTIINVNGLKTQAPGSLHDNVPFFSGLTNVSLQDSTNVSLQDSTKSSVSLQDSKKLEDTTQEQQSTFKVYGKRKQPETLNEALNEPDSKRLRSSLVQSSLAQSSPVRLDLNIELVAPLASDVLNTPSHGADMLNGPLAADVLTADSSGSSEAFKPDASLTSNASGSSRTAAVQPDGSVVKQTLTIDSRGTGGTGATKSTDNLLQKSSNDVNNDLKDLKDLKDTKDTQSPTSQQSSSSESSQTTTENTSGSSDSANDDDDTDDLDDPALYARSKEHYNLEEIEDESIAELADRIKRDRILRKRERRMKNTNDNTTSLGEDPRGSFGEDPTGHGGLHNEAKRQRFV